MAIAMQRANSTAPTEIPIIVLVGSGASPPEDKLPPGVGDVVVVDGPELLINPRSLCCHTSWTAGTKVAAPFEVVSVVVKSRGMIIVVVFHVGPERLGPPISNVSILVDVHGIVEVIVLVPTATSANVVLPSAPHNQKARLPSITVEIHRGPTVAEYELTEPYSNSKPLESDGYELVSQGEKVC